jgi:hypothetical protein
VTLIVTPSYVGVSKVPELATSTEKKQHSFVCCLSVGVVVAVVVVVVVVVHGKCSVCDFVIAANLGEVHWKSVKCSKVTCHRENRLFEWFSLFEHGEMLVEDYEHLDHLQNQTRRLS